MSKQAKKLVKALERSQSVARAQYCQLQAAVKVAGIGGAEMTERYLVCLEEYIRLNDKMQTLINVAYGESSYDIGTKAVKDVPQLNN